MTDPVAIVESGVVDDIATAELDESDFNLLPYVEQAKLLDQTLVVPLISQQIDLPLDDEEKDFMQTEFNFSFVIPQDETRPIRLSVDMSSKVRQGIIEGFTTG